MRTAWLTAVIVVAVIVSASLACAEGWDGGDVWGADQVRDAAKPSWFGSSGMIVVPTAQTVAPQSISAHYHSINIDDPAGDDWMDVYGANVGITDGLEAGITHLDTVDETLFQAKYNLHLDELLGNPDLPDVAFGSRDIGDKVNRVLFVTVTKDLVINEDRTSLLRATVGYGDVEIPGAPLDGIFGGIDFTPFDYMRVMVEHDGENINASASYWWAKWLCTEVGALDGDFAWGVNASSSF